MTKPMNAALISIRPDYTIAVSASLNEAESENTTQYFRNFNNKAIQLPTHFLPDKSFLEQHYHERFKPYIQFNYLYRDAGNNKQYGEIVFANSNALLINEIEAIIRENLIEGRYFMPSGWAMPHIYKFAYDPELDHDWFEYESVEETNKPITDSREVEVFLKTVKLAVH